MSDRWKTAVVALALAANGALVAILIASGREPAASPTSTLPAKATPRPARPAAFVPASAPALAGAPPPCDASPGLAATRREAPTRPEAARTSPAAALPTLAGSTSVVPEGSSGRAEPESCQALLALALGAPVESERAGAVVSLQQLGRSGDPAAPRAALLALAERGPAPAERAAALEGARIDGASPAEITLLVILLHDREPIVRAAAARLLGEVDPEALPDARAALLDAHRREGHRDVVAEIASALTRLGS